MVMKKNAILNIMIGINSILSYRYFKQEHVRISYKLEDAYYKLDDILISGDETLEDILQRLGLSDEIYEHGLEEFFVSNNDNRLRIKYVTEGIILETSLELLGEYRINVDSLNKVVLFLAEQIQSKEAKKISEYKYLFKEERMELLYKSKGKEKKFNNNETVITYLEKFAYEKANKIALTFDEKNITYAQLNESANIVAHHLIRNGVKRDEVVGLALERGEVFIIVCLALWKIGAAYMPIACDLCCDIT